MENNKIDSNLFVEKFAEQFEDTSADTFKLDTIFRDIEEWDSMIALSIIAMVDETFNAKLTGEAIKNSKTIEDLIDKIETN